MNITYITLAWLLVGFSHQNSDYVYTLYLTWCPKCSERSIWILDIFFSVVTVHTEKHRSNSSHGRNLRQCFHWYSLSDVYTFFIWNGRMIDILIKWYPWFILPTTYLISHLCSQNTGMSAHPIQKWFCSPLKLIHMKLK